MTFVKGQVFTEEHKARISAARRGKKPSPESNAKRSESLRAYHANKAAGHYISKQGYRVITTAHNHPLRNSSGDVGEHRMVLYDQIGPGPHPCHWGCGKVLDWGGRSGIQADHLNGDKLNNSPQNLVPSCSPCNISRRSCGDPMDWSYSKYKYTSKRKKLKCLQ